MEHEKEAGWAIVAGRRCFRVDGLDGYLTELIASVEFRRLQSMLLAQRRARIAVFP